MAGIAVGALCGLLRLPMIVAAPLATLAMTVYNFAMTRWAITRRLLD